MTKKRRVAMVQARMGSLRLPGKVMLAIQGKPILWHMVERLKKSKSIDEIMLVIPDTRENDILEQFAKQNNITYFRGSEHNLLERHYFAAKQSGAEVIVRIPSDNSLVDPVLVDMIVQKHLDSCADYTSNVLEKTFPAGFHTEVFGLESLEKVFLADTDEYQKEHATPYMYQHPELFKLQNVRAPKNLHRPQHRVTLDTKEDFDLIAKIYQKLYTPGTIFTIQEVIDFLDAHE